MSYIVIKHKKSGAFGAERAGTALTSHIDTLRALQRTLRRAGVDVAMSEGFNPHMLTYSAQPLPLGVESEAEYFAFQTPDSALTAETAFHAYSKSCNAWLEPLTAWRLEKNPNLAGRVVACAYAVSTQADPLEELLSSARAAGGDRLLALEIGAGKIRAVLGAGDRTLNPLKFLELLAAEGIATDRQSLVRTAQYARTENGGLVPYDEYLDRLVP